MEEFSIEELLGMMDITCESFSKIFNENISDESIGRIQHRVSIALIESTAEETETDPETVFQTLKNLIDIESWGNDDE